MVTFSFSSLPPSVFAITDTNLKVDNLSGLKNSDDKFIISEDLLLEESMNDLLSLKGDFVKFMEGIENLPPYIQEQGAESVAKWLTTEIGVEVIAKGENLFVPSLTDIGLEKKDEIIVGDFVTEYGTADCIIAVGLLIGSVGFPLSKILKLKQALNLLGGISKTISKINAKYKLYKSWNYRTKDAWKRAINETSDTLPNDVKNAFLDFFSIGNVIRACT